MKELKLTENPAYIKDVIEKGDRYIDTHLSQFICPVVGVEMNGKHRLVLTLYQTWSKVTGKKQLHL